MLLRAFLVSLLLATVATPSLIHGGPPPDPSITTQASQCYGPVPGVSPLPSIPKICYELGFASCGSMALNFTLTVDDAVYVSEDIPHPLDFTYPYPISGSSCIANVGLSHGEIQTITPTYVHVRPGVTITCGSFSSPEQKLDWLTFGVNCEELTCSNCTSIPQCGWCSSLSDFQERHSIDDWTVYEQYQSSGTCLSRGVSSQPWCAVCALTYSVDESSCPVYTGAAGGGGGGEGGTGTSSTGEDEFLKGNKTYQALFGIFILVVAVGLGILAFCCWKKRRIYDASSPTARYAKSVELKSSSINDGPGGNTQAFTRLTGGDMDAEYIPPTVALNSGSTQEL